jgi:hypothetical protein
MVYRWQRSGLGVGSQGTSRSSESLRDHRIAAFCERMSCSCRASIYGGVTSEPHRLRASTTQPFDPVSFVLGWAERVVIPPSATAPFPTPQFLPMVAPTSLGSSIKNIYNAVEPWVRYGFDIAAYAVGWIPYVGWLAPQITIFYNFGERIARSITYNIADFLDGHISFVQGLINVGVDTFNSFVQLGIDQLNFWLPGLPPLPPFPFAAAQSPVSTPLTAPELATAQTTANASFPTPTTLVTTKRSTSPTVSSNVAPMTQLTVPGLADALTHRNVKLTTDPNMTSAGQLPHHDNLPAASTHTDRKTKRRM